VFRSKVAPQAKARVLPCLFLSFGLFCTNFVSVSAAAEDVEELTDWLLGDFDNRAQFENLDQEVLTTATPGRPWVDLLHARFFPANVEGLEGASIYLQWHNESAAGPISRQRIWHFGQTETGLMMKFFMLKPGPAEQLGQAPPRALSLTADDLIGYPAACDLPFQKQDETYLGSIPQECKIVAQQSGRTMFIGAQIEVTAEGMTYRESGLTPEGVEVFRVPGTGTYQFAPVSDVTE